MARKPKHEDHVNHEAWAIPYGDLVTLLLAFFVVMYAVSSINEGKFRVLSEAMSIAFGGPPRAIQPIELGELSPRRAMREQSVDLLSITHAMPHPAGLAADLPSPRMPVPAPGMSRGESKDPALEKLGDEIERKLAHLVTAQTVRVRRGATWLEVEIRTDILFASASAELSDSARQILAEIGRILAPMSHPVHVEGHTDNLPIQTRVFPSNWELSASRAASVVHVFGQLGVAPPRMSVVGYGEYRPRAGNDTAEGRNQNRRVTIVVRSRDGIEEQDRLDGVPRT
jgi:chemotaxis protein MotB